MGRLKGVGRKAKGKLKLPTTGLFGGSMCPRSASHKPMQTILEGLRDVSLTQGWISDPYLPYGALHGPHWPRRDFTWLENRTIVVSNGRFVKRVIVACTIQWKRRTSPGTKLSKPLHFFRKTCSEAEQFFLKILVLNRNFHRNKISVTPVTCANNRSIPQEHFGKIRRVKLWRIVV